jgi:hypothetical protein
MSAENEGGATATALIAAARLGSKPQRGFDLHLQARIFEDPSLRLQPGQHGLLELLVQTADVPDVEHMSKRHAPYPKSRQLLRTLDHPVRSLRSVTGKEHAR